LAVTCQLEHLQGFCSELSVSADMKIGPSLSVKLRLSGEGGISVSGGPDLGGIISSSLSASSFVRLGSSVSSCLRPRIGSGTLSALDTAFLGSSVSVRSLARLGSQVRVFGSLRISDAASDQLGSGVRTDRGIARSVLLILSFNSHGRTLKTHGDHETDEVVPLEISAIAGDHRKLMDVLFGSIEGAQASSLNRGILSPSSPRQQFAVGAFPDTALHWLQDLLKQTAPPLYPGD
jgi:hypothetical protein